MGLTAWENHHDFLVWQRAKAQRDLATLKAIPALLIESTEAKERGMYRRHKELITKIQAEIDHYTTRLEVWEQKRPKGPA